MPTPAVLPVSVPMIAMRLYVDGLGKGWAIVRCNACTDVDKFPAVDAFDAPVKCRCGQMMDVRDSVMAAVSLRSSTRHLPAFPFNAGYALVPVV